MPPAATLAARRDHSQRALAQALGFVEASVLGGLSLKPGDLDRIRRRTAMVMHIACGAAVSTIEADETVAAAASG